MNKEKLEEMILEKLVNEARNDRTVDNMPNDYKETARGTFGDMVNDDETLKTIWLHYGPSVVNYASNQDHKLKLSTLGGDESKVEPALVAGLFSAITSFAKEAVRSEQLLKTIDHGDVVLTIE